MHLHCIKRFSFRPEFDCRFKHETQHAQHFSGHSHAASTHQYTCCFKHSAVHYRVVGWYHSHPTFATFPSMIDIANQVTQQNAHKTSTCEPYIAAIVGPYNKKLPTCQSSMTWFYVNHEAGRIPAEDENPLQAGCTPMQLQVCLHALLNHLLCFSLMHWFGQTGLSYVLSSSIVLSVQTSKPKLLTSVMLYATTLYPSGNTKSTHDPGQRVCSPPSTAQAQLAVCFRA